MSNSPLEGTTHEVGESVEADFETDLWSFRMEGRYCVSAGRYAILPVEKHEAILSRLEWATRILRGLCDTESEASIGEKNHESIHAFFDPEPLA